MKIKHARIVRKTPGEKSYLQDSTMHCNASIIKTVGYRQVDINGIG